jgi:hypothetical protein
MASRRAAILDGTNSGLLAAILAVPLLALVVWLGPVRGFAQRADAEQVLQRAEIERLIERKRTLTPIAASERERVDAALTAFEADVATLGANPNAQLVRSISTLLEAASAHDVRVTLSPPSPTEEPGAPLAVAALDGARPMTLVPNAVHVALRSDFTGLRAALDALREPGRTIQIESADFTRDGANVKATLELVYWSRESAQ